VGGRWATAWKNWAHYESFFSQMVRWSMRPPGDDGQYTVATELVDGQVEVIVTALDKDDEFRNFLDLAGKVVGPAMEPLDLRLEQVAPGRYRGTFAAEDAGSYFVILGSEGGGVSIRTGVDVPYSAEFRQRETNDTLLRNLARLVPEGGTEGLVIETAAVNTDPEALRSGNVFRHDLPPATSSQGVWPLLLLLGSCLFFGDVFIRRVHVHFGWVAPMLAAARDRVLRRERQAVPSEYMERLRSRKAELTDAIETRRAAARFEPTADPTSPSPPRDALDAGPAAPPVRQPPPPGVSLTPDQQPAEESYTERLLKAKKKVWDERDEK